MRTEGVRVAPDRILVKRPQDWAQVRLERSMHQLASEPLRDPFTWQKGTIRGFLE